MTAEWRWRLFEVIGVELEYAIVDRETLSVRPIADRVREPTLGQQPPHVVAIGTDPPAPRLDGLASGLLDGARRIDEALDEHGARLMPCAMHPLMDPRRELEPWPSDAGPTRRVLHRVFDVREHGWSNQHGCRVSLPFSSDEEFGRLHAAVRMLLPVLPALAAASPVVGGRLTGFLDSRLEHHRHRSRRLPSVAGRFVPEPVFTQAEYEGRLLARIYRELASLDPEGTLRHEWVNGRGCIPRFDRGVIEIRALDVQECPEADLAICAAVVSAVRGAVEGAIGDPDEHRRWSEHPLAEILADVVRHADTAVIRNRDYLRSLGYPERSASGTDLWRHLVESTLARESGCEQWASALEVVLDEGCLARRIVRRLGADFGPAGLLSVYRELCDCLAEGRMLRQRA